MDEKKELDYEHETGASFTDSLTGLFNHGFFQLALDSEIKKGKRYGTTFTLALIDVDSFAIYNRIQGALKGEKLLRKVAQVIMENIRDVDMGARFSGDTFALIIMKSETAQSLITIERINKALRTLPDGEAITLSVGIASYPGDAINKESLIRKAEEALLQAKLQGRNRVNFFKPASDHKANILIVDDEPRNLKLLEAMLIPLNYKVIKVSNGNDAISIANKFDVDLILLDIMMPDMDGYEVCCLLKNSEKTRMIPIVMVTALNDTGAKIKGIEAGADDFLTKPPDKMELKARVKSLIKVKTLNNNLTNLESILTSLANAVEAKDEYTKGHIWRVSRLAVAVAKKVGLSEKGIDEVKFGGIIHDIGKIGIPKDILNKPGALDDKEFDIMKKHSNIGYKICEPLKDTLGLSLDIIRFHHEKLDGSGYPNGLKGDDIPIGARIMTVVDIYDALTTDRPYRKAMSEQKAFEILNRESEQGKLDKQIIENLIEVLENDTN